MAINDIHVEAAATALAIVLSASVAIAMALGDPWWAAMSAWLVSDRQGGHVVQKSLLGVMGTVIGCLAGYVLVVYVVNFVMFQLLLIAVSVGFGVYMRHRSKYAYAWFMGCLMFGLVFVVSLDTPDQIGAFVYSQSLGFVVGVVVATIVAVAFAPWHRHITQKRGEAARLRGSRHVEHSTAAIAGVFGGIATVIVLIVWETFDIPIVSDIYISVAVVLLPTVETMRRQVDKRIAGCLLGGSVGIVFTGLGVDWFPLWLCVFFFGVYVIAFAYHDGGEYAYVGKQAGMAFILAMVTGNGQPDTVENVVDRVAGIAFAYLVLSILAVLAVPWIARYAPKSLGNIPAAAKRA